MKSASNWRPVALVLTLLSVSILMYRRTQKYAEDLEEAHNQFLEFISMVAHELANRLAVLNGYRQLLTRWDDLSLERRDAIIAGLDEAVQRLRRLTADLSDMGRLGTGRFEIERTWCDLNRICLMIVEQQQVIAPYHQVLFETPIESLEGFWDCERLAQVISNLIDNAVKYSPAGSQVRLTVDRHGEHVLIAVSDEGIGLHQDQIARLFDPYVRVGRTSNVVGLGFGLYIVKGIDDAHNGRVWVESTPGHGATFFVELPIRAGHSHRD